ncbi:oligopeptide ABC transporter ATP-binding protein [Enemella dayhoffiae]|uniref:Oligopeptide ABC transporter ATP-binding protein n=1 Tax=Enemella dayhoffiae TaxID=2016507 RepID=A0A255GTT7_9ACTN|nr:ABC transporter ATP-binding protein [Enemella dayhoffiae]OYO16544.1 oligopeptide ABC transporter ATP-binding protein [Enemella dayhoffiae]
MTAQATTAGPGPSGEPLLQVRDLSVTFRLSRGRRLHAVRELNLEIARGETLAIVGESGSGKSTTARALLRLLPQASGSVRLAGQELMTLRGRDLRLARRGAQMVFQDPYSSLNPAQQVWESIVEPLQVHDRIGRREQQARAAQLLEEVGLRAEHAERYPHEFSGGQRQRIAIARAIAVRPELVVADEPVSALDVSSQNQVLRLLERLSVEHEISLLFISHDLGVVRHIADRVAVMYLGRIVEQAPTAQLFEDPQHPYTRALLSAALVANPRRQAQRRRVRLSGDLPDPTNPPPGCPFVTRCPDAMPVCSQRLPQTLPRSDGSGAVACHLVHPLEGTP